MKMTTTIYSLEDNGTIEELAIYSLEPKAALIAFIQQSKGNMNTWDYPTEMVGIHEKRNRFYFLDLPNNITIGAIQR